MSKKVAFNLTILRVALFAIFVGLPFSVQAGFFSSILTAIFGNSEEMTASSLNSQTIPILQPSRSTDSDYARGGGDITVLSGTALLPESGPAGTMVQINEGNQKGEISTYVVRSGDTLSSIAKSYGVSTNTIIWANDLKGSTIREGQKLVILPITGIKHTVKSGDTLSGLAKKYGADIFEITTYNNLQTDSVLAIGDEVIIPGGKVTVTTSSSGSTNPLRGASSVDYDDYYIRPIVGGIKTQGLHGYNAVDLANYWGAPVYAAADGRVTVSLSGGWNGGYGSYIVVSHSNGTQTLYSHLSSVEVGVGEYVSQGQVIGKLGSTGKSTGPHLHFEIRGARNPF